MKYSSELWHRFFLHNRADLGAFPWADEKPLAKTECEVVAASIQQFQLGEGSDGRNFLRLGARFAKAASDPWFVPALQLFIAEEQMHSKLLRRFLQINGIPTLERHWVDSIFRLLRKLMGLETCVSVLVTAECIAVPYYRALRDATRSRLLHAICDRILSDEARHLEYQGETMGRLRERCGWWSIALRAAAHRVLLVGTVAVVWKEHYRVFVAAEYSFARLLTEANEALNRVDAAAHALTPAREACHDGFTRPA